MPIPIVGLALAGGVLGGGLLATERFTGQDLIPGILDPPDSESPTPGGGQPAIDLPSFLQIVLSIGGILALVAFVRTATQELL